MPVLPWRAVADTVVDQGVYTDDPLGEEEKAGD